MPTWRLKLSHTKATVLQENLLSNVVITTPVPVDVAVAAVVE